jgi:tetratricopeptide (TPR) repeat protein
MFMANLTKNQQAAVICLVLALVTAALYWPMTHHEFIAFDDDGYITGNPHVNAGLTWSGVAWAFQSGYAANWHPLTWLSHMLDCQWYGLNPGGHHSTNLLFHLANTLLLFLWLHQLTGALWRSAFVAALFAWHPLHVESVAWAAERKDVLSGFFFLLTLWAYTRYAQKRSRANITVPALSSPLPTFDYLLALLFFACGLMSKPMVVTLPLVLLLLDFWPLNRLPAPFSVRVAAKLFVEKLPFFALAAAGSVVTYLVQKSSGAFWSAKVLPLSLRVPNAVVAYVRYISKTFWPVDLALIYPYPHRWHAGLVVGVALLLALWTGLFIWRARRQPFLLVGWLWFLGTLVPTIGLVQVGVQSMADRYLYLPSIGLFILVAWGVNDFLTSRPSWRPMVTLAGGAALAGCLAVTRLQLGYWHNSLKLFLHTVKVTTDNYAAYNCLGSVLEKTGKKDEALALYAESVRVEPDYPLGQFNLGMMLLEKGRTEEALGHLNTAQQLMPQNPDLQFDLGVFWLQHGRTDEAIGYFTNALADRPAFPEARNGLGTALLQQSKLNDAVTQFSEALRLKPDYADAHRNLALALTKQGRISEAISHYREALRLNLRFPHALNELAWILATAPDAKLRSGAEAVQLAERACELTRERDPAMLATLSAAYAETGRFAEAKATAQKARGLAQAADQKETADQAGELLKLFQVNRPFREKF